MKNKYLIPMFVTASLLAGCEKKPVRVVADQSSGSKVENLEQIVGVSYLADSPLALGQATDYISDLTRQGIEYKVIPVRNKEDILPGSNSLGIEAWNNPYTIKDKFRYSQIVFFPGGPLAGFLNSTDIEGARRIESLYQGENTNFEFNVIASDGTYSP